MTASHTAATPADATHPGAAGVPISVLQTALSPAACVRLLSALHILFFSLFGGLLVVAAQGLISLPWLWASRFLLLPALGLCAGAFVLPLLPPVKRVRHATSNLRAASLVLAGLTPFIIWWTEVPHSAYLLISANGVAVAGGCTGIATATLLHVVAGLAGRPGLAQLCLAGRDLCYYLLLLPVIVFDLLFVGGCLFLPHFDFSSFRQYMELTPPWLRGLPLVPCIVLLVLIWRVRTLVLRLFLTGTPGQPVPEQAQDSSSDGR